MNADPQPLMVLAQGSARAAMEEGQVIAAILTGVIVYLAMPAVLWFVTWRVNRKPQVNDRSGEPRCGQCGYIVRGLSELNCPECGADLREVGIHHARRSPTWWWVFLWSLANAGGGMAGIGITILLFGLLSGKWGDLDQYGEMPVFACVVFILSWMIGFPVIARWRSTPPIAAQTGQARAAPSTHAQTSASASADNEMTGQPVTRTLTIMFIDMADYTERTARSSRGAVVELIQRLRSVVQPVVTERHGRIVKTIGDGLLVTFESPTEAVLAGGAIQQAVGEHNTGQDAAEALALRIGITTGEVALESNDVYGEPVNLAARVQQATEPGQTYFSEATYHAMTRSEVPHEEAGRFELKGVGDDVLLYRVVQGD